MFLLYVKVCECLKKFYNPAYSLFFSNFSISEPFDKELETGKNYLFGINEVKNEKLAIHWLKISLIKMVIMKPLIS